MIALYMRLSGADGDLDGCKAESNSISNQRAILTDYVVGHPDLASQPVEEFVDDGFSGSNFDRPEAQRMLDLCKEGRVDCIIVKDLSRFAREYIDAGMYIEQVFPFLRVRFISISEGYDSAVADIDRMAPDIAIRNIANAAYCRETSIRIRSTQHTKWKRGLRPHAMPPFGYMVDPEDPMRLAIDERMAPVVRHVFALAVKLKDSMMVAKALTDEGVLTPGIAFRELGLYGYDKRPEPKKRHWTSTQVNNMLSDPVYKGTLVTGKTRRKVMSKRAFRITDPSERYVTEGAHPAIIADGLWLEAQGCIVTKEHLKGVRHSASKNPFSNGFLVRAECGHSCKLNKRRSSDDVFTCKCDCAEDDGRCATDSQIAGAVAAELRRLGVSGKKAKPNSGKDVAKKKRAGSAASQLEAYERYVAGKATIEDYRSLEAAAVAPALHQNEAAKWIGNSEKEKGELLLALEEHRFCDVDRKLLRKLIDKVLLHSDGTLEVVAK